MKLSKFKQFESIESNEISEDDIKEVFYELLDDDYEFEFYDTGSKYSYSFQFKKILGESEFDPIDIGLAYGVTNLEKIQEKQSNFLSMIEEAKSRIDSMGYHIGFEFEFHFGSSSMIFVSCHMQNKKYGTKDSFGF